MMNSKDKNIVKPVNKPLQRGDLKTTIVEEDLPVSISFDVCTYCNHKCSFCSSSDYRTLKNKVSLKDFETVMDNICSFISPKEIALFGKGEPLLNKNLPEMVALSKRKYKIPYVFITTNGSLMTKEKSAQLLECGLDSVKFSINASSEDEYYKIHGKNDFQKAIKNLEDLLLLKKSRFPTTRILVSSIQNLDISEKKLLGEFVKEELQKYVNGLWVSKITYTSSMEGNYSADSELYSPCPLLWERIYINSNCKLNICCRDYFGEYDMGDLRIESIEKAYNNEKMLKLRSDQIKYSLETGHICYKCINFTA